MSEHDIGGPEEGFEIITGFWRSAVLRTMLDLNIADHLEAGLTTVEEIARAATADPGSMAIFLDALCGLGICDKRGGQYLLEPMAARLFGGSGPLADAAELWLNGYFWSAWGHLTEVVRTGQPVEALGVDHAFWESTFAKSSFDLALRSGRYAKTLVQLRPGARVLDVGCGSGGFGYALALEDPTILVTSLDGEAVLEVARHHAERLRISDRVSLVVADAVATDSLGQSEFDVAVLSNVLHLFDPVRAEHLVRKAFEALASGGTVVVAD